MRVSLCETHNQICYHRVRETVAAHIIQIAKEGLRTNLQIYLQRLWNCLGGDFCCIDFFWFFLFMPLGYFTKCGD